jgi:lipoprotein-anchoring transpeptidase ErfK/SrfK
MRTIVLALVCGASLGWLAGPVEAAHHRSTGHRGAAQSAPPLSPQAIENASPPAKAGRGVDPATIKAAIMLDRAGFSPGVIDGRGGENFKKALSAYQAANGLERTGRLDPATWGKLTGAADQPVLTEYAITADDLKGPFIPNQPRRLEDMAELPHLGYAGAGEELAEKFHMSEDLLRQLNPSANLQQEAVRIVVANVTPLAPRGTQTTGNAGAAKDEGGKRLAARIEVAKSERAVRVLDRDGGLLAYFPASIGSAEKPAPSGVFKVTRVSYNPIYHYDPKFAFKGVKAQRRFEVQPGPNNPVGLVWIDLSAPSYGIHGTPNPDAISKTQSHGCVRLTNWDAMKLAALVRRGTPVEFVDQTQAAR